MDRPGRSLGHRTTLPVLFQPLRCHLRILHPGSPRSNSLSDRSRGSVPPDRQKSPSSLSSPSFKLRQQTHFLRPRKTFPPFFHHQIRQETGSAVAASRSALSRGEHRVSLPGSSVPGGCPTRVFRASGNLSDRPVSSTEPRRLVTRRSVKATVLRVARAPEPPFSALPGFWVQAQLRILRAGGERGALGCSRPGPPLRSRVRARSARGQLRPRVTCRLRAAAVAPARATALGLCWSAPGSCAPQPSLISP